ncbi:cell division cycle protein-like protein Cdc20 [Phyllosticta citrichinensis]|uniref:Cell division cycle protein-like protein Cdc20 n=1 Tax=Phyllosticta citrichinensis TaxID=1130410 RepID=A0ABR1XR05_9PEZI
MACPLVMSSPSTPTGIKKSSRLRQQESPQTPVRKLVLQKEKDESIHVPSPLGSNRQVSNSSKTNISRNSPKPKKLDLGLSELTLTGSGKPSSCTNTKKTKKAAPTTVKSRPQKSNLRVPRNPTDRFIPQRLTTEAIENANISRSSYRGERPTSSRGNTADGSSILASAANNLNIFGPNSADEELIQSFGRVNIHDDDEEAPKKPSPRTLAYQDSLAQACDMNIGSRILEFKPAAPQSNKPVDLRAQYNRPLKPVTGQLRRRIASAPERVLDAPSIVDDYYLNLLDWSAGNQVAIALERSVYVWSADTGSVNSLFETPEDTYVTSVKWSGDGAYISAGLDNGEVQIWDVEEGTKLRSMFGHEARVGVMGWNKHILSTGDRTGLIVNHDVRVADHNVAELAGHTHEVCGLEWRSDGQMLASGGNDNYVNIWDARHLSEPKHTKTNHNAAVKALAWCPWQLNLLATGGGSNDKHIHFWNSTTGARLNSIDTGSQVTSLRWSTSYKEIVSTGGFPNNALSVWSYPSLVKNIEIPAHEQRILFSSLSPDGQTLATASADENLKFWKLFEKKAGASTLTSSKLSALRAPTTQIR